MTQSKHTPIPWKAVEGHDIIFVEANDAIHSPLNVIAKLGDHTYDRENAIANAAFIVKAVNCHEQAFEILDILEDRFDKEIYEEQKKEDFDAPDDREYSVTITAKQMRMISLILGKEGVA